jgi:hypothetical protein
MAKSGLIPSDSALVRYAAAVKLTISAICSRALYVDDLVEESELMLRQTGAALGERSRLAARVAAPSLALSLNGCKGRKSRIARRGKPR